MLWEPCRAEYLTRRSSCPSFRIKYTGDLPTLRFISPANGVEKERAVLVAGVLGRAEEEVAKSAIVKQTASRKKIVWGESPPDLLSSAIPPVLTTSLFQLVVKF